MGSWSLEKRSPDEFFASPLTVAERESLVYGSLNDSTNVVPGQAVLELNFTRRLHHFERHKYAVSNMLTDVANQLDNIREQGNALPDVVVGYTFERLARVAVRAFGFEQVGLAPIPPEILRDPLQFESTMVAVRGNSNGRGEPVAVAMSTDEFIRRYSGERIDIDALPESE